jgi:hypothetical protein
MTWKHILAGLCGFSLGFWFCMPRDVELLPRYEVLVVDAAGKGFAHAYVKESREDHAITGLTTSTLTIADDYGRAAFPLVRGRTSPLLQTIVCVRLMKSSGMHTPCGYSHQITTDIPGYTESSSTEAPLPLKKRGILIRIIMQPH